MATSTIAVDQKEVAIEQLDLQVDLIDEGQRRAAIVFPPAGDVRELKGRPVQVNRVTFETDELSDIEKRSIEAEFERVYSQYDRYKDAPTFLSRLALLARLSGREDLALELIEQAARFSASPELMFRWADAKLAVREDEATNTLGALVKAGYVPAALRSVELAIQKNHWEEVEQLIAGLLDEHYQDWRIQLVAGTIALRRGDYEQSIHHFRIAQEDRPRSATISQNIAIAQYALGNTKQAIKAVRRTVALSPFSERALAFWADILIKEKCGETNTLIQHFENFLSHRPDSSVIAERAADLYLMADAANEGLTVLRKVQSAHPTPALLNNIGVLYWSKNQLAAAQRYFVSAFESLPENSRHLYLVAANAVTVLLDAGDAELVERIAAPIIEEHAINEVVSNRSLARIFGVRTAALFQRRKYDQAILLAERSLRQENMLPRLKAVLTSHLVCYYALVEGDYESALSFAEQELEASRSSGDEVLQNNALNNITFALIELGRLSEAKVNIDSLRVDFRGAAIFFATRGLFQIRLGSIEKGEASYRKAISATANSSIRGSIRQKLNLELAKYWLPLDRVKAFRYARSAQKIKSSSTGWDHKKMRAEIRHVLQQLSL